VFRAPAALSGTHTVGRAGAVVLLTQRLPNRFQQYSSSLARGAPPPWPVLVDARAASSAVAADLGLSACCQPDNSSIPPSPGLYGDATLTGTVTENEVLRALLVRPEGEITIARVDIAALLALVAALISGVGDVIRQRSAQEITDEEVGHVELLRMSLRDARWWLGGTAAVASAALQAVALGLGSVVLVQALQVTALLFALPVYAWMTKQGLMRRFRTAAA
jgi:hypothetical protein